MPMKKISGVMVFENQKAKHWDAITPTKRSAHIRDRLTHADNFDFLRDSVQWFATCMEVRLRENDDKGGWSDVPDEHLLEMITSRLWKAQTALSDGDHITVVNELADLANFAMMLAENVHQVAMEPGDEEDEAEHDRE